MQVNINYLFQKTAYTDQDKIIVVSLEEVRNMISGTSHFKIGTFNSFMNL